MVEHIRESSRQACPGDEPDDTRTIWMIVVALVCLTTLALGGLAFVYTRSGGPWLDGLTRQNGELAALDAEGILRTGDVDEAIAAYASAVKLRFNDPQQKVWALQALAELLLEKDRFAEAAQAMNEATSLNPDDLKSYRILSQALQAQGSLAEALAAEQARYRIASLEGNVPIQRMALLRAAQLHTQLGHPDRALAELENGYANFPDNAIACECATRLVEAGRDAEAKAYLDKILQGSDPSFRTQAQRLKEDIGHGQ